MTKQSMTYVTFLIMTVDGNMIFVLLHTVSMIIPFVLYTIVFSVFSDSWQRLLSYENTEILYDE